MASGQWPTRPARQLDGLLQAQHRRSPDVSFANPRVHRTISDQLFHHYFQEVLVAYRIQDSKHIKLHYLKTIGMFDSVLHYRRRAAAVLQDVEGL